LRILLATDGSDEAAAARQLLQALPLPSGSTLRVISVVNVPAGIAGGRVSVRMLELLSQEDWARADRVVHVAAEQLSCEGLTVSTAVRNGEPAAQIILAADEFAADLVVVGSKGLTGLQGFFLGSVARSVAKRAPCPVLVARAPRNGLRQVVVATDGSDRANRAIEFVARLPLPDPSEIRLVHVVRPYVPFSGLPTEGPEVQLAVDEVRRQQEEMAAEVLAAAAKRLTEVGRSVRTELRVGDPTSEILELAEALQADLIVAGARGAGLLEGLLLGSVADRLLKEARCSVLIVH
jgi:nucleotide-binding universal stress UspA family protein